MHADISVFLKLIHLIPVMIVYVIIFSVIYGFTNYYAYDVVLQNANFSLFRLFEFLPIFVFYFCAFMVLVCHSLAMCSSPGKIVKSSDFNKNDKNLFCGKCDSARPYRSHHCKVCNKCILKMDHHCQLIANCVGLCNQKFFFLFLLYATIGDGLAFICLLPKTLKLDLTVRASYQLTLTEIIFLMKDQIILILSTLISFSMTVSIGFLFIIQHINISKDLTTIENKIYSDGKSPWGIQGDKKLNFKKVLGEGLSSLLPIIYLNEDYNKKWINTELTDSNYITLDCDDNLHINLNLND